MNYSPSNTQYLAIPMPQSFNNRNDLRILIQILLLLFRDQTPQLVHIDDRTPVLIACQMEMSHTNFPKVTRMILVKVGSIVFVRQFFFCHCKYRVKNGLHSPMVMKTASKTTTTRMFAVFSYTSVTRRHMPSMFTSLGESGWHYLSKEKKFRQHNYRPHSTYNGGIHRYRLHNLAC